VRAADGLPELEDDEQRTQGPAGPPSAGSVDATVAAAPGH
jgi:hypothetical protein